MTLFYKGAGAPQQLSSPDYDAQGRIWTDLANNPDGRAACGWVEAPPQPAFNSATQSLSWDSVGHVWAISALPAPPPAAASYVVDVPTFMLRFTAAERIAIRKSIDAVVEDFMALLNDPRTTHVNLALDQVEQAVGYLAGLGGSPLNPPLITPARVAAILAPA